jgi:hypothetical protein
MQKSSVFNDPQGGLGDDQVRQELVRVSVVVEW